MQRKYSEKCPCLHNNNTALGLGLKWNYCDSIMHSHTKQGQTVHWQLRIEQDRKTEEQMKNRIRKKLKERRTERKSFI